MCGVTVYPVGIVQVEKHPNILRKIFRRIVRGNHSLHYNRYCNLSIIISLFIHEEKIINIPVRPGLYPGRFIHQALPVNGSARPVRALHPRLGPGTIAHIHFSGTNKSINIAHPPDNTPDNLSAKINGPFYAPQTTKVIGYVLIVERYRPIIARYDLIGNPNAAIVAVYVPIDGLNSAIVVENDPFPGTGNPSNPIFQSLT